jgi:hypothetical protein
MLNDVRDKFGRSCFVGSIGERAARVHSIPSNVWIKILRDIIIDLSLKQGIPFVAKWYWPEKCTIALCPTHDVDHLLVIL